MPLPPPHAVMKIATTTTSGIRRNNLIAHALLPDRPAHSASPGLASRGLVWLTQPEANLNVREPPDGKHGPLLNCARNQQRRHSDGQDSSGGPPSRSSARRRRDVRRR